MPKSSKLVSCQCSEGRGVFTTYKDNLCEMSRVGVRKRVDQKKTRQGILPTRCTRCTENTYTRTHRAVGGVVLAYTCRAVSYWAGELISSFGPALSGLEMLPADDRTRFSRCLRLQNHTLTTSFSRPSESAILVMSREEGFGCARKWRSSVSFAPTPIDVRLLRRRSGDCSSSL